MSAICPTTKTRAFNVRGGVRGVKEGFDYLKAIDPKANISLEPGLFGISWDYDASAIAEEIGFVQDYTMEKGIDKTLDRFRQLQKEGVVS
jgi:hypothetical protein